MAGEPIEASARAAGGRRWTSRLRQVNRLDACPRCSQRARTVRFTCSMTTRAIQLVLHYDGSEFAGWQRQPSQRTVQGVLEDALQRLAGAAVPALGAGRRPSFFSRARMKASTGFLTQARSAASVNSGMAGCDRF